MEKPLGVDGGSGGEVGWVFMAAVRLHRGGAVERKSAFSNRTHLEGPTTGPIRMHGENAPRKGAFCYVPNRGPEGPAIVNNGGKNVVGFSRWRRLAVRYEDVMDLSDGFVLKSPIVGNGVPGQGAIAETGLYCSGEGKRAQEKEEGIQHLRLTSAFRRRGW